ncbi:MAG: TetR/AcrR family transcriptional regulator [Pseudomonadota bacterium]
MRTKDEKLHERRKAEILEAAKACFSEKGIRQTTMQEICKRAAISPGALYRYFASKEEIIGAIAAAETAASEELIAYLAGQKNIVKGLVAALPEIVEELSNPALAALTLEIVSEAARNPDVAKPFLAGETDFKRKLAELLKQGQASGRVEKTLDADAFADLFSNLLDSIAASYAFPNALSPERAEKTLAHVLKRSLTPRTR